MIKTFVKKPVKVQAVQWTGDNSLDKDSVIIETLEGNHYARKGDWIIRGINGEFYPCKPDIFEKTYVEVGEKNGN